VLVYVSLCLVVVFFVYWQRLAPVPTSDASVSNKMQNVAGLICGSCAALPVSLL